MGICNLFKNRNALPVETQFNFPFPLPTWLQGGGFANGIIDIGGIEVCQISTFTKVWATNEGGADNLGVSFFNPTSTPNNFYMLGSYAQPNNKPLFGYLLVARDTTCGSKLAKPLDFTLTWSSESSNIKKEGDGYFWLPVAPNGYKALGHVVTNTSAKPSVDSIRCVLDEFTDLCENDLQIWSGNGLDIYSLRPVERSIQSLGIMVGTFVAKTSSSSSTFFCLKNKNMNYTSSMPNITQIQTLIGTYSPLVYFHPDEEYLPSSVSWFFEKGALLYRKDNPNPSQIDSNGSNLPQGGSNDGQYWLDLPSNDNVIKRGDLPSSKSYFHVKPMFGGTCTDIAIWIFYPFNGPAKAKVAFFSVKLGRIGEHVGDWEHVTLRVSNFTGKLLKVYFGEHSSGSWVDASELEYEKGGNKFHAYASLNGHAFYMKPGLYLQGDKELGIGIRNDCDRGKSMDTAMNCELVAVEYGDYGVVEPVWLEYMREWGPKVSYDIANELKDAERFLPKKLRNALEKFVGSLPDEVLGEEGPTGPKEKNCWIMDEKY